ncbi:ferrous iron transport protein B [Magnetococcales bacterium HHB-1]
MDKETSSDSVITVALVGNPNCGKTSIFNRLTGKNQHVANYGGVTVDAKEGEVEYQGQRIRLIDLPGIYSLSSSSQRESIVRRFLFEEQPDMVLNILEAGHIERHLFLSCQIIEMGIPRIYCLNMIDEAKKQGIAIDQQKFSQLMSGPTIETIGHKGEGNAQLLQAIINLKNSEATPPITIPYDPHLEAAIERLHTLFPHDAPKDRLSHDQARWLTIKLLEGDIELLQTQKFSDETLKAVYQERLTLESSHSQDVAGLLSLGRHGFIRGLLKAVYHQDEKEETTLTSRLDQFFLHRVLGLPLFFLMMWGMFQTTFTFGAYPADAIDALVSSLGEWVAAGDFIAEGAFKDLLVEGVIGGAGSVLVFLPNIVFLFLFIALFEDTGYMARVPFLVDRAMRVLGLPGKAIIPMMMGFGCNVPAIMAVRTLENPRDRLVTILVNPFVSCAARLPVFVLLAGAFFGAWAGTVVFLMYLSSIIIALLMAFVLKKGLFREGKASFVMELPPYRMPTLRSIMSHMLEPVLEFLKKVSSVVLVGSILVWFLQSYPQEVVLDVDYDAQITAVSKQSIDDKEKEVKIAEINLAKTVEEQQKRYLGQVGSAITPLFVPIGLDEKASVALLTGVIAKEMVVSALGVMYQVGEEVSETSQSLQSVLRNSMPLNSAAAFMVFVLLYMPCLSTVAVILRETNSWKWTGFSVLLSLSVAWSVSFIVYRVGALLL